ncbi:relaxase/mobilization nuclease domain-containing protein [Luteolibacter pohnpeiensis]
MAYTAKNQDRLKEVSQQKRSGAKLKNPVLAFSLSWHPEQKPNRESMMEAALTSLEKLGLSDHETMIACHTDEPQPHIHVVVNKVHPRTGLVACLKHSKRKLQDWVREYQKKEKTNYCPQRELNHQKREKGKKTRYANPAIVEAWKNSHDAKSFMQELQDKGYQLAQGRKRLVLVDPYGKTSNPVRDLKSAFGREFKEAALQERMTDIDPSSLPTPEAILERRKRHEEKVAALLTRQTEKHRGESMELVVRFQDLIDRKRDELATFYRLNDKLSEIGHLQDQLQSPGLVQRIGFVLFRSDRKLKLQFNVATKQIAVVEARIEQALSVLEQERERKLRHLELRQSRECKMLIKKIDQESLTRNGDSYRHVDQARGIKRPAPTFDH